MFVKREETQVKELAPGLTRRILADGERLMVCSFEFSEAGIEVPRHAHAHEQVSYITQGRLRYCLGDEEREVEAGDSVWVAPDTPHAVVSLEPAVVLDSFSPPREDFRE